MQSTSRSAARSGFTIVEMAVVLVLGGLILAIAMPRANSPERRLTASVRETWSILSGARQQAVLKQHDVHVDFDSAAGALRILHDRDNDGVRDAGEIEQVHALEGVRFGRGAASAGPAGESAIGFAAPAGATLPRLTFHRSGSGSVAGGFYLRTERASSSTFASEVRAITLERATGRVSVFHPAPSDWERTW